MTIPVFVMDELMKGLKRMKKRRSPDMSGIVVELIQHASTAFDVQLLDMYNGIISSGLVPADWHLTVFPCCPKVEN